MTTMNKKIAGLMALTMVATMSPMTAFAADTYVAPTENTYNAVGEVEAIIDKEIFTVCLPTIADSNLVFTMDPQKLISATSTSGYASGKTLYFTGSGKTSLDNSTEEYEFKIGNAVDVDVSLTASVTGADKLKFSTKNDWSADGTGEDAIDNSKAHIYLGIITTAGTSSAKTTAITADGATVTEKLTKLPDSNFKTTGSAGNYTYEFDTTSGTPNSFKLQLTGEANPDADWSADGMAAVAPAVKLVWNVKKHVESYLTGNQMTSTNLSFPIASGAPTITSVTLTSSILTTPYDIKSLCTITSTALTFNEYLKDHKGGTITVTFAGGATETITIA